jgi:DnaK suppressor protein
MAKEPSEQQKTDAERIPSGGSGKLDQRQEPRPSEASRRGSLGPSEDEAAMVVDADVLNEARGRLERDRRLAVDRLRVLVGAVEADDAVPQAGLDAGRDEGDQAQATERADMELMTRERLTERIERLTAALERIQQGRYGRCEVCGRPITASRLAALPETETCRSCQERRETETPGVAA